MAQFKNITKKYGSNTVLENFSLRLEKNCPTVIMGESGKGKTTLLRIAAGLEKPDSGDFSNEGETLAFMFQEPRLLPWKSALDNVRAPLPKDKHDIADRYFSATGLDLEDDGKKHPNELSGGMQQRAAFARFLAYAEYSGATCLLLDEPFSSLDTDTAEKMALILREFAKDKVLAVVSHDESDAEALGARTVRI